MTTSIASPPLSAVANLVLVRMALPEHGPAKIRKDIGQVLGMNLSAGELATLQQDLMSNGLMMKGRGKSFNLTDAGRERALQVLNLTELPTKTTWAAVLSRYLFPQASGLPASETGKLTKGDNLAACLLKQRYELDARAGTTVDKVFEAILCKKLGYPQETTLDGLFQRVLYGRTESDGRLKRKEIVKHLPLVEFDITRLAADDIRRKLVRDWFAKSTTAGINPPVVPLADVPRQAEPFDLPAFASTVRTLAAHSPATDRFHDNKVFIAPLWRASQQEVNFPRLTLSEFKQRMIEANGRHLLHLSRADMVQAMDPQVVSDSETSHLNATFHFLVLEGAQS